MTPLEVMAAAREAALTGDFDALAALEPALTTLAEHPPTGGDATQLRRLKTEGESLAATLSASRRGIAAARRLLAEIVAGPTVYGMDGRRAQMDGATVDHGVALRRF